MGKLRNAGLVAAALVLAGTGTLAAQDTSYTRTPAVADTSAPVAPLADTVVSDTAVSDTAADTLGTDVAPAETTGAAVTTEPAKAPSEAKPKGHEGHDKWDEGKKAAGDEDAKRDDATTAVDDAQTLPDSTKP
ncbi:MAG: hypothetical protein ACREOC_11555 [Gemmatimonadales bacterium]